MPYDGAMDPLVLNAFHEHVKTAFVAAMGRRIVGGLHSAAGKLGHGTKARQAMSSGTKYFGGGPGGQSRFHTAVGAGTLGVGGAALAGRMTAPRRQ